MGWVAADPPGCGHRAPAPPPAGSNSPSSPSEWPVACPPLRGVFGMFPHRPALRGAVWGRATGRECVTGCALGSGLIEAVLVGRPAGSPGGLGRLSLFRDLLAGRTGRSLEQVRSDSGSSGRGGGQGWLLLARMETGGGRRYPVRSAAPWTPGPTPVQSGLCRGCLPLGVPPPHPAIPCSLPLALPLWDPPQVPVTM